ncbi:synaptotagmin-like protein 2 isoform X1 [Gambusia affinis]|uniref:synaptotagmin-like protein 2 isoform X1 n=1 Tax=Gambusia affinis TaxID=33528 RepID=UPI001CDD1766|nr:synaptotagmin-like protein 2 isoform X1 [Gambusia affinis]XP_043974514.1 synaptotagmin-like protein 2 isoform X1 [Gambusia affinis]
MIDLSHLTEEEQEVILMVLKRDEELKRAEEERIRKLEKVLDSGSQSDVKLKYLSGEWFYEAKSQRHSDKIHGSEIILASMKQGKPASLDGSVRVERSKTPSRRSSDAAPPTKPARCFEPSQPPEMIDAEKENRYSSVRSPKMPRHNPFNRASLIVVEPPENNQSTAPRLDQETQEAEAISRLKNAPAGESSQTSGGSVTSESSSTGFRPVPKKRTFLPRRGSQQGLNAPARPAAIVPAPRRSRQLGSSGSSNQSGLKITDETPQGSVNVPVTGSAPTSSAADKSSLQPLSAVSQVSSNSSLEIDKNSASITKERPAAHSGTDVSADRETPQQRVEARDDQRERATLNIFNLPSNKVQDRDTSSSVGTAGRQEEMSLPPNTLDPIPPMSYDLHFIDKSNQQAQKPNQMTAFKLSSQTTSPTGEEDDSIAKVLDWFNRSTDSSDWLNSEDTPKACKDFDKHASVSKSREEESFDRATSERKLDRSETNRSHLQKINNELNRKGSKETLDTQHLHSQDVRDSCDESKPLKISHLKSFWEKSNTGPKILISKSGTPADKGVNSAEGFAAKEPDVHFVSGKYNGKGLYDKYTPEQSVESRQQPLNNQNMQMVNSIQSEAPEKYNNDSTHLKSISNLQTANRRVLEGEGLLANRPNSSERTIIDQEFESDSAATPNLQPDGFSGSKEFFLQDLLSKTAPGSQLDPDLTTKVGLESENFSLSRNGSYMDENEGQLTKKAKIHRDSVEDVRRRDSEDKNLHSGSSPKRKDDPATKDRAGGSYSNKQPSQHQESTAERIKQLKSFWEQELNKPTFYNGKPKGPGEGKVTRGENQTKLTKRFTKSEFDLRSIGNDSGSDEEGGNKNPQSFTVLPLNQRLDKMNPSLGTSRAQFNFLREFWDEATADSKASLTSDKPKSPKRKEPLRSQLSSQDLKSVDAEIYHASTAVEKTRGAAMKSFPSPQSRAKSPHDKQVGPGSKLQSDNKSNLPSYTQAETGQQKQFKRSAKDFSREEKSTKPQSSVTKDIRSPKSRKDSLCISSSRGSSLRRATSMFALSADEEKDPTHLRVDLSPLRSQSRKHRQLEPEFVIPRARAFVPTDYRHYLGMTDKNSIRTTLTLALSKEAAEVKSRYDLDLGEPLSASTPLSSEERDGRKTTKISQRPVWANYSSSDTGPESSVSSTSETWSNIRNSSKGGIEEDEQNPVRKALRRAEARPKNLAKSMEDITASAAPRQERRADPAADLRRNSEVSAVSTPSSSSFSDPDHLKKMSKSVPSFLQKEVTLSPTEEQTLHRVQPHEAFLPCGPSAFQERGIDTDFCSSATILSSSPGMTSVSSLSGSVMTMYSGDFVEVQGTIQFSINYVQRLREFHIFVAECRDLAAVDPKRNRSDPYVKSYLVPDKANLGKRKTSVKKKTLNPTFNEILRYRVRMEYLRTQTLILSVWHHDTFGKNSFLGEVDVELSKWDFDHTQMNYLALKARTLPSIAPLNGRGEMRLAIRYLPQVTHSEGLPRDVSGSGEIHIWVKECKNLPLIRATIDPYVKCFVLPDTSRKSRQKTRVLRRTVEPVFNHTMVYDGIGEADLTEACVELTVWDRDRLASNLLGGLRLGVGTGRSYGALVDWMDSGPYEVALWDRMMASPNEWVEDVLPLRMLSSARTALK